MASAVGLTGGIGSGKTLAGKIFSSLGIPVFNADEETKRMYDTDTRLREQLVLLLGKDIYQGPHLQRTLMAARIFSDPSLLQQVEQLVHPALNARFVAYAARQEAPYVLLEAAILFESGIAATLPRVIAVSAPETLRIQRVVQRDKVSEDAVRRRMQHQWTEPQRLAAASHIIINDEQQAILPQVIRIHEQLIKQIAA
jgi:dephospho-CoA kinase